jgi:hypothetical protein
MNQRRPNMAKAPAPTPTPAPVLPPASPEDAKAAGLKKLNEEAAARKAEAIKRYDDEARAREKEALRMAGPPAS